MNLRMSPRPTLQQGLILQQRMTPQLILLMQLLVRPCHELRSEVLEALVDNPALEEGQDDDDPQLEPSETQALASGASEALRLLDYLHDDSRRRAGLELEPDQEDRSAFEPPSAPGTGLTEHLLDQLREEFDGIERVLGEWIIGNLDGNGYLCEDASSIAARFEVEPAAVAQVLHRIHTFDPIGVAGRDAQECLLIQARARFPDRPHLASLIEHHLPAVRARQYPTIARTLGLTVADVLEEERRLIGLNPRPARGFGADAPSYVLPDVSIIRDGSELRVRVNDDGLPKLRVSPYCRQILRNGSEASPEELAFVRAKVTAATWFVKCIYTRQETIRRVTEAIVARQRDFFDRGREYLRPMLLRDIAGDVELSESTVSRVTSQKYADTPQGVLGLKSLFGAGLHGGAGTEVASESVKCLLSRMLALENPHRPLSDQQIMSRLRDEHHVMIARRTVAKYREVLGIGSSSARRPRGR